MWIADLLSRAVTSNSDKLIQEEEEIYEIKKLLVELEEIRSIELLPISDERVIAIQKETKADVTLQQLAYFVLNGWPDKRSKIPNSVKPYWCYREQITSENGLLHKSDRIIVPAKLREDILRRVHASHQGTESSKKLPMQSHEIPQIPFNRVAMDIFEINNPVTNRKSKYLATVDYFSDFFELDELKEIIVCDNGTQLVSKEILSFFKSWEIKVTTSSPRYAQSNGKAESAVKIAKRLIKKALDSGEDVWLAVLNYRNTPNAIGSSPAQRLMSRRLRSAIPAHPKKLLPEAQKNVHDRIMRKRQIAKSYYDQRDKIQEKFNTRSYIVNVKGSLYRRNIQDISKELPSATECEKITSAETREPSAPDSFAAAASEQSEICIDDEDERDNQHRFKRNRRLSSKSAAERPKRK
ncbi:PREDICTED: uncharacterized protein K02A2.6-like, partial [Rhagoletis zephyria]|uniref:uncharacterized protein K02A2.6-like n=1 Tax=Rhagoletis zephyria TaxID=28612 RepID=UPI00081161B0